MKPQVKMVNTTRFPVGELVIYWNLENSDTSVHVKFLVVDSRA